MANPNWQPGTSGNPNGRPVKNRAWTEILEKAGSKTVEVDGKGVARKRLIADMVMQAASTGVVTFPDATALRAEFKEWADFVKWIYTHIDGPAKQEVDLTANVDLGPTINEALKTAWGNGPNNSDD